MQGPKPGPGVDDYLSSSLSQMASSINSAHMIIIDSSYGRDYHLPDGLVATQKKKKKETKEKRLIGYD